MTETPAPADRTPWTGRADAAELEQWTAVAERLAEQLAQGARHRDRENASPVEALALVRVAGLPNLLIPNADGGHGAHWETVFHVVRIVARADASIGQILGYHYLNQACVAFYGSDPERRAAWFRRSAAAGWLWSDSFNPVSPDLSFRADGEDYVLDGLKRFATGSSSTDILITGAVADGGSYDGQLVVLAIDSRRAGVVHLDDWDNLGYRASDSGSVRYESVRVTSADIIGVDEDEPFSSIVTPGVQLLFGNIYLAVAQSALAQARELVLARPNAWFLSGVDRYADDPQIHRLFGALVAKTAAVEALADRLNRRFDEAVEIGAATTAEDRGRLEVEIAALKVIATEVGLDVSSRVFEAAGASATRTSVGLDRFWRDVRTHTLHDPVAYKEIEVGAHYLTGAFQPISLYT